MPVLDSTGGVVTMRRICLSFTVLIISSLSLADVHILGMHTQMAQRGEFVSMSDMMFSPDDKQLLYCSSDTTASCFFVMKMDLESMTREQVVASAAYLSSPSWTADGGIVFLTEEPEPPRHVCIIDGATSDVRAISQFGLDMGQVIFVSRNELMIRYFGFTEGIARIACGDGRLCSLHAIIREGGSSYLDRVTPEGVVLFWVTSPALVCYEVGSTAVTGKKVLALVPGSRDYSHRISSDRRRVYWVRATDGKLGHDLIQYSVADGTERTVCSLVGRVDRICVGKDMAASYMLTREGFSPGRIVLVNLLNGRIVSQFDTLERGIQGKTEESGR